MRKQDTLEHVVRTLDTGPSVSGTNTRDRKAMSIQRGVS